MYFQGKENVLVAGTVLILPLTAADMDIAEKHQGMDLMVLSMESGLLHSLELLALAVLQLQFSRKEELGINNSYEDNERLKAEFRWKTRTHLSTHSLTIDVSIEYVSVSYLNKFMAGHVILYSSRHQNSTCVIV